MCDEGNASADGRLETLARLCMIQREPFDPAMLRGIGEPQAYRVQRIGTRIRQEQGDTLIGYKVGCLSPEVQQQLGITQPIYGPLFVGDRLRCGARLRFGGFFQAAIEGELAVELVRDLPQSPASDAELAAAVGAIFPVIELHDCLRSAPEQPLAELIARRGLHAGFVAADRPLAAVSEPLGITVEIDGRCQGEHVDADPLNHIIGVLRWLHSRLLRESCCLRRGQIVLCGTRMGLYPISGPCRLAVTTSTGIRVEATMVA